MAGLNLTGTGTVWKIGNKWRVIVIFNVVKSMAFICQANYVLLQFKGCDPATKMKLFNAYCLSLYTCSLWRLDAPDLASLEMHHLAMLSD